MNKLVYFFCAFSFWFLYSDCSSRKSVVVFDQYCKPSESLVKEILYDEGGMVICSNSTGSFYRYSGYATECGEFSRAVFDLEGVTVGEYQYNTLQFNTELPLDEAAQAIAESYRVFEK